MKAILPHKRRFTYKDILRIIGLTFFHYFFFFVYTCLIFLLRLAVERSFLPTFDKELWVLCYPLLIAPCISAFFHVLYAEIGSPWFRAIMWLHMMLNIVFIPVIALS